MPGNEAEHTSKVLEIQLSNIFNLTDLQYIISGLHAGFFVGDANNSKSVSSLGSLVNLKIQVV